MTRVIRAGRTTFAALSVPNYRRYYGGQAISLAGTWMQMTAQAWLVLTLTHSSTALGVVIGLQTLPVLLLGPYGGVIADRVDKRRLMIILQSAMGVQALILGVLTVTGVVQYWQIGVLAALLGLNNAFENPARQSFMLEMVGPEYLRNAVSLNSVLVNTARVIGPAVAGILIATVGIGACFLLNSVSFAAVVASLVRMDRTALSPSTPALRAKGQLREGLRYVRRTPDLAVPLLMMAVAGCLTYEFQVTLPVMATRGLHVGATGFGFMTAAMGLGAVAGGLLVAARGKTGLHAPHPRRHRIRRRPGARHRGPQPAARACRPGPRRVGLDLVHVDGQLHPAADRRPEHARTGHVLVVRRLPGLDADRRAGRGLADGRGRSPSGPRTGHRDVPRGRARRPDCPSLDSADHPPAAQAHGRQRP